MSYDKCTHGKSCGYDICPGEECEHFRAKMKNAAEEPKPSPEAVIKSLEACAEPFAVCDDCAFGPCDPYGYGCADKLKLTAAELLRVEYVPGEWETYEDEMCETVYKCPACGEEFTLVDGTIADNGYNHCPNCGKRLTIPKEV